MRRPFEGTETISQYWSNQPLGRPIPNTAIAGRNAVFDNGRSRVVRSPEPVGVVNTDAGTAGTVGASQDRIEFAMSLSALRAIFAPSSWVLINRDLHVVKKLIKLTGGTSAMVINPSTTLMGAVTVKRTPTLFPIYRTGRQRGSLFSGNVALYRGEAYFGVGRGELQIDGDDADVPFTATGVPYVAYPTDVEATAFDFFSAGFEKPDPPTVTAEVGGTKGMIAGERGFRIVHGRTGFGGYNLPSDPDAAAIVAIADDGKYEITAPTFPVSDGTDSFSVYVTKRNDGHRGPWYFYKKFEGVGPHEVEFLDEELGSLLDENAYPPPPCLRIVDFGDLLLYVSFTDNAETPGEYQESGPGIAVAKASNPEAVAPVGAQYVVPAEDIVGCHIGQRYGFVLTSGRLNVFQRTGNNVSPLQIFPFGQTGFTHQGNGVVIDDVFYGITGGAIVRTVNGEDMNDELGFPVKPDIDRIIPARAILAYDARSQRLVIFENQAQLGAGDKWQCLVHSCNLNDIVGGRATWNAPVILGDGVTADFIVTGQVTIEDALYFCTADGQVMEWDSGDAEIVGWLATNFAGVGATRKRDAVRSIDVIGGINGTMRLYRDLAYGALIGTAPDAALTSVAFTLSNPTNESKHYPVWKLRYTGESFALRFDFSQPGGSTLIESFEALTLQREGIES